MHMQPWHKYQAPMWQLASSTQII